LWLFCYCPGPPPPPPPLPLHTPTPTHPPTRIRTPPSATHASLYSAGPEGCAPVSPSPRAPPFAKRSTQLELKPAAALSVVPTAPTVMTPGCDARTLSQAPAHVAHSCAHYSRRDRGRKACPKLLRSLSPTECSSKSACHRSSLVSRTANAQGRTAAPLTETAVCNDCDVGRVAGIQDLLEGALQGFIVVGRRLIPPPPSEHSSSRMVRPKVRREELSTEPAIHESADSEHFPVLKL
jgi:hypothetical protein